MGEGGCEWGSEGGGEAGGEEEDEGGVREGYEGGGEGGGEWREIGSEMSLRREKQKQKTLNNHSPLNNIISSVSALQITAVSTLA